MASGAILLSQIAGHLTTLDIACNRCDRRGKASVARLLAEHGASMPVPALLRTLSADCPVRQAGLLNETCGIHLPQLSRLFGVR